MVVSRSDSNSSLLNHGLSCKVLSVYAKGRPTEVAITGKVVVGLV